MQKSNSYSYQLNTYEYPQPIRKSRSCNCFTDDKIIYEDLFEGDGLLGIQFKQNYKHEIYVNQITDKTVASEYYDLRLDMVLEKINDVSIHGKSFENVMKKINNIWEKNNQICLQFKKNINKEISQSLLSIDYVDYYDDFIKLGVKELNDYEFIEYSDLIQMNIPKEKIQSFQKLNKKINPEIYDFCKEMDCIPYFEQLIDIGVERIMDFEILEYNDLIDISMDEITIDRFKKRFKSIRDT